MKSSLSAKKETGHRKAKKANPLKFYPTEQVPIATRDYGLMFATKQALTPFPRVDVGVDANLLKARLSMRRQIEIKRMSGVFPKVEARFGSATTIKTNRDGIVEHGSKFKVHLKHEDKTMLSLGTPHPTKGVALNAKSLSKRLIDLNEKLKEPDPPMAPKSSRTTKKKKVRLMDTATVTTVNRMFSSLDYEQLSEFSNRVTQLDYSVSDSLLSVESMKHNMNFAERRKAFNEGEFTIARYGKKMSDVMMASTPLQHKVVESGTNFAQKANEEIEKYILSQGLIKTTNDQLKWTHEFNWGSSNGSTDSMFYRPQSIADIYRDIKQRKQAVPPFNFNFSYNESAVAAACKIFINQHMCASVFETGKRDNPIGKQNHNL